MENGNIVLFLKHLEQTGPYSFTKTYFLEKYDRSGNRLSREDISDSSEALRTAEWIDSIVATDSGLFLLQNETSSGKTTVYVCDKNRNMLGKFVFDKKTALTFTGECAVVVRSQKFAVDDDPLFSVSRMNIGEFEILPPLPCSATPTATERSTSATSRRSSASSQIMTSPDSMKRRPTSTAKALISTTQRLSRSISPNTTFPIQSANG